MNTPLRVLIIEDSQDDAILIARALRQGGYEPTFGRVDTPAALNAALSQGTWDIIIADYSILGFSGLAALNLLQESGLDLPFIIVSDAIGEEVAVTAMKAGAHDYVMKDNLARLVPAVQRELREAEGRRARVRAEHQVQERQKYLEGVLEAAPDAIVTLDPRHRLVEWNPGAERLFGYSREEAIGQDIDHLITNPGVLEQAVGFTQTVLSGKEVGPVETIRYRKDGSPVDVILAGSPILMGDELIGIVAVYTDITERVRAEEEIHRRNRELALLNQASQALSATLDPDQVLHTVLEEVRRLLGVAASSVWLLAPETGELVCQEATGPQSELVRGWRLAPGEGLAGRVAQSGESLIVSDAQADARYFKGVDQQTGQALRSILTVPLRVRQKVIGVLQVVDTEVARFSPTDLALIESLAATAAIAIENARLYAEEQRRAAALTHTLEQQRELDRLKDKLIQNVSHELRTPLAIVRGYAELLSSGELGELQPGQREPIAIIARRMRMLSRMMDDLAAMLEVERQKSRRELVDLADLMHKLLTDFRVTAEESGLTLTAQVAPDLPPVAGDPIHLQRVVDNLLGNALKFTPAGGRIAVRLEQEGENLVLEVSDTGIGIPADQLGRIFERFYQVNGSMSRRYTGSGLGLALVKEMVEAHGGQVSVRSEVGRGSTFTVTLPISGDKGQALGA